MAIKGGDPILEKQNWSTWFFGLCAFMALSYGAVVYQEFVSRRTYIYYQQQFRDFELDQVKHELANFQAGKDKDGKALEAALVFDAKKEADLKARLAAAEKAQGDPATLLKERKTQFLARGYAKSERAKVKSNQDALFYQWKRALHLGNTKRAAEKEKEYQELETKVIPEWTARLDAEEKKLAEIDAKIAALSEAVTVAKKELETYRDPITKFEERMAKVGARSVRTIDQIQNDRLGIGGAYTFGTVDRCRTCHLPVDRPGFESAVFTALDEKSPFKKYDRVFVTHPAIDPLFTKHAPETYGCTVCHGGQGRATRIKTPLGKNPDDFVFKYDMDQVHGPMADHGAHQWEDPLKRGDFVQSSCQRCHAEQRWLDFAPVYEKGKDLFIEKGCHGCHVVKGYEELPKVAPELTRIKNKVTAEWLVQWIENPKAYYPNTRMPMFVFDEVQVGAPDPKDNVAVMVKKDLQADTATKMAAYLWQNSMPSRALPFGKFPGGGNVDNGQKIIETVGCLGCHAVGEKGTHRAPPLEKAGGKMASADWIWNWIRQPRFHADSTIMPNLRLSDDEARDVTAYLWSAGQKDKPAANPAVMKALEDPANAAEGFKLIAAWGCAGCHAIPGQEKAGRIGPELTLFGEKKPFELAFGDTKVPERWLDWTEGKLHNPRQYVDVRSAARMPWFNLSKEEIHALTIYLAGQKDPKVPRDLKKQFVGKAASIERGRALVNHYNCVGCHLIEKRGGDILAINKARELRPPNLNNEGLKIQADFLRDFIKSPTTIRPWLKIRMPTFPLADQERTDIIAYFRALDGVDVPYDEVALTAADRALVPEGEGLFKKYNCQSCHIYKGVRGPAATDDKVAPDLGNVPRRYRADGLEAWLRDPQKAMPGANMPSFFYDGTTPIVPDDKPSKEGAERQIDAIRAYLLNTGSRQISMSTP